MQRENVGLVIKRIGKRQELSKVNNIEFAKVFFWAEVLPFVFLLFPLNAFFLLLHRPVFFRFSIKLARGEAFTVR